MFDILIRGGLLIDGTGAPAVPGDLAIQDGVIAARGNLTGAHAARTIEAAGFCVTPGFLDIHRHADAALLHPEFGECELRQGLTTIVNGNCGMSPFPCTGENASAIRAYLQPVTAFFHTPMRPLQTMPLPCPRSRSMSASLSAAARSGPPWPALCRI